MFVFSILGSALPMVCEYQTETPYWCKRDLVYLDLVLPSVSLERKPLDSEVGLLWTAQPE